MAPAAVPPAASPPGTTPSGQQPSPGPGPGSGCAAEEWAPSSGSCVEQPLGKQRAPPRRATSWAKGLSLWRKPGALAWHTVACLREALALATRCGLAFPAQPSPRRSAPQGGRSPGSALGPPWAGVPWTPACFCALPGRLWAGSVYSSKRCEGLLGLSDRVIVSLHRNGPLPPAELRGLRGQRLTPQVRPLHAAGAGLPRLLKAPGRQDRRLEPSIQKTQQNKTEQKPTVSPPPCPSCRSIPCALLLFPRAAWVASIRQVLRHQALRLTHRHHHLLVVITSVRTRAEQANSNRAANRATTTTTPTNTMIRELLAHLKAAPIRLCLGTGAPAASRDSGGSSLLP